MSYDLHLTTNTIDGKPVTVCDWNITYNLAPMFRHEDDLVDSLRTLNGLTGKDAGPLCLAALTRLIKDPEHYQAMEPDNGWGTYDGAVSFLCEIATASFANPSAVWEVS
jgi:hypothetical protein